MTLNHLKLINEAHKIAKKNFGKTFPNPVVGCIIAKKNTIISRAVTSKSGRPHAEEIAIKKAGKRAKGSTMYVTLEPCFHNSSNGSCTDQILRAGIKKIYISSVDPDIRTKNKSIKKLKDNKVVVIEGLESEKTYLLNKFFFISLKKQRPFIKVKMAISNDEKIAWHNYQSKWISNTKSRKLAHIIRSKSQAILTTAKTIIKDDPRFTIRLQGKIDHLNIIIIDNLLKIPTKSKILQDIKKRIIIFTSNKKSKKIIKLQNLGCEVILIKKNKLGNLNLNTIVKKIYNLKISDVLVEAGGILFSSLVKSNLIDELHIFQSNFNIGEKGIPVLIDKKIHDLKTNLLEKRKIDNNCYYKYNFFN